MIIKLQDFEAELEADRKTGKDCFQEYFDKELLPIIEGKDKLFAAELKSEVVGFISAYFESLGDPISSFGKVIYILDLIVDSKVRSKGIARLLVEKVKKFAKAQKIEVIKVNTLSKNYGMQSFLSKSGFREYEVTYLLDQTP